MTQKEKINGYDVLAAERDLLSLYFYDRETNREPDAREREGNTRMKLYRATGAQGGYVVVTQPTGSPHIELFEHMKERMAKYYDNESLPIRLCLERLWIARSKMFEQVAARCLSRLHDNNKREELNGHGKEHETDSQSAHLSRDSDTAR